MTWRTQKFALLWRLLSPFPISPINGERQKKSYQRNKCGEQNWKRTKINFHVFIQRRLKLIKRAESFHAVEFFGFPIYGEFQHGETIGGGVEQF